MLIKKWFVLLLFLLFYCFTGLLIPNIIGAQAIDTTEIGISVVVNDTNVQNGNVICSNSSGYKLCNNEYDSSIYGIVDNSSSAAIKTNEPTAEVIVSKGDVEVKVSSTNGNIKKGDFLTSSKIAGVAQKAIKQGYVIGIAGDDYSSNDKNAVGQIKVSLNIHVSNNVTTNNRQNLIELLRNGISGLGVDPISALRYILAAAVVVTSLVTGFIYFGRIAKTGVEAIGRNPLAGGRIEASVIANILIMIAITGAGLIVAYLILAL